MENNIGVITRLQDDKPCFSQLNELDLTVCQLCSWQHELWTEKLANHVREEAKKENVRITGFWAGWPGPRKWNFVDGPGTLGLIPKAYRERRITALEKAGQFASHAGIPAIITHLGFIPENPSDPVFNEVVIVVRHITRQFHDLGIEFWFETGQETPVTMLRFIRAVDMPNLGVNLDPANLILYGKGNPIDALDVFGTYVRNIHAKDGSYPTDPMKLGREVKVGQGQVQFPKFVRRLNEIGFTGEFIIEREISGEQQRRDIAETVKYLKQLLNET